MKDQKMNERKMQYEAPKLEELEVIDFVLTAEDSGGLPGDVPGENPFT